MKLRCLPGILCGSVALLSAPVHAASYTWKSVTGDWGLNTNWVGDVLPPATSSTTELIFTGNVSTFQWTSTNNIATVPFQLNQITLTGVDASPATSGMQHKIQGNALQFLGTTPEIAQNGSANVVIENAIDFNGSLLFSGNGDANGPGTVTLNGGISGIGDITKTGTSTFRFGTIPNGITTTPSANTWMGNLIIDGGTVRFNNNAQAGSSALRANPVNFTGNGVLSVRRNDADETAGVSTSLRMGTLSGSTGTVQGELTGINVGNFDVVITAITSGTFGGTIILPAPIPFNSTKDGGDFVVRGPGTQTLTGTLDVWKDSVIGYGTTLVLSGDASLHNNSNPLKGAITFAGGTVKLDNSGFNVNRLRDGSSGDTSMETIGGGTLQLIGNASGTDERTGRLQLGSANNPRSGHLKIEVVSQTSTSPLTQLVFQSYNRDQTNLQQFSTVEFAASQPNGSLLNLGTTTSRIYLTDPTSPTFTPPLSNSLLTTTAGATPSVGWAIINNASGGASFATYNTGTGVGTVVGVAWSASAQSTANVRLTGSVSTAGTSVNSTVNSLRITGAGTMTIAGADILSTTAFLLTNGADYLIQSSSTGGVGGSGPRFFHVQNNSTLTVDARLNGSANPIVKAGDGTLELPVSSRTTSNASFNQTVALNGGMLRATPGSSLPMGELRLRGGQLEIQGGGTFSRTIGAGANTVNWSGVDGLGASVGEDRGSGGFAAYGADVSIDLNGAGANLISWEDVGFVSSGYALVFGSKTATHKVTWTDNLSLSTPDLNEVNYNAREIRVLKNPGSGADSARISGSISGRQINDLLKTGPGDLELTGSNTYAGATIVQAGRLFVNGNSQSSFLHKAMTGTTLAGSGSVGKVLIDAGGKLAPGISDLTASVLATRDLQLTDATSVLSIELGGITAGGNNTNGYDQLNVTGTVTLNGADLQGSFLNGFVAGNDVFFLILNDGTDAVIGQFADGSLLTIGGQTFNISYTADSVSGLMAGGNDVAIQLVPEPSSALFLGLGGLLAARRRRREN